MKIFMKDFDRVVTWRCHNENLYCSAVSVLYIEEWALIWNTSTCRKKFPLGEKVYLYDPTDHSARTALKFVTENNLSESKVWQL
jgi:hypothetical protein